MSLLEIQDVVQRYRDRRTGREILALSAPSLRVEEGEVLAVEGPNGSGKSTLLETLACLRRPGAGRVLLEGQDPWRSGSVLQARRRLPMLLQQTVLFSGTALGNVMYGTRVRGVPRSQAAARAHEALALVGLQHLAHRRHSQLSGGERRRVALARLLALESRVLILDEPTSGLDAEIERLVEVLLRQWHRDRGTTIILASHNRRQTGFLATRVVTLQQGLLVPTSLENLFAGTAHLEEGALTFTAASGWSHRFPASTLASPLQELHLEEPAPVQLGLAAASLGLSREVQDGGLTGEVHFLRRQRDVLRLRVRVAGGGPSLRIRLPWEESIGETLTLGSQVHVTVAPGSIRVIAPPA